MATAVLPNPTQQAEIEPEPQYGENFRELPENLQNALRDLLQYYGVQQDRHPRRFEVMDARRQRFYERDQQYIVWNSKSYMYMPVTGGSTVVTQSGTVDMPRYTSVYNIYKPYQRSLIAVLTQNPPGVDFEPDDPSDGTDICAAEAAEKYRHKIDRDNDRRRVQTDIARMFTTDGRTIIWTRPDEIEGRQIELMTVHGVLESKVPITSDCMDKWPYCVLSDEIDIEYAKHEYDWVKNEQGQSKIKPGPSGSGETAYERFARIGVLQGTWMIQAGDAFSHLVTRHNAWFRACAFEHCPEAEREQLKEIFPNGCRVVFCGEAYCEAYDESMDEHLALGFPYPGDGMNRPSLLKLLVAVQDAYNDYRNLEKEYLDYGIPMVWYDQRLMDVDARREQNSEPGNSQPVDLSSTNFEQVAQAFFVEPPINPPAELRAAYENLQGALSQFMTGALPALFGGADADNTTKGGIAMMRDQAMGQMGLAWGAMQSLMAKAYKQAVKIAANSRDGNDTVNVSMEGIGGKSVVEPVAIQDLQAGNFHCYPDTDSSFPETTQAKRQAWMTFVQMLGATPEGMEVLQEPANQELTKNLLGVPEAVIPGAEARDKQLQEIDQMLEEKPIPPNPMMVAQAKAKWSIASGVAGVSGMPAPPEPNVQSLMQPSVPIDPEWDYHQFEYETIKAWLSSPEGLEASKDNPVGVQNVKLHGEAHKQAMIAQMPPPMPQEPQSKSSSKPPQGEKSAPEGQSANAA